MADGLRISEAATALGYSHPSSFSTALKRVRIPRDVAESFRALIAAAPTVENTRSGPRRGEQPKQQRSSRRTRKRSLASGTNKRSELSLTREEREQLRETSEADQSQPTRSPATTSSEGAPLVASATVYSERGLPVSVSSGHADVERRRHFVEQLNNAQDHLSKARESLQSTIESGSATLVTQPGVQRILDMLQHLREELAAT
jgi:hypothetical protein